MHLVLALSPGGTQVPKGVGGFMAKSIRLSQKVCISTHIHLDSWWSWAISSLAAITKLSTNLVNSSTPEANLWKEAPWQTTDHPRRAHRQVVGGRHEASDVLFTPFASTLFSSSPSTPSPLVCGHVVTPENLCRPQPLLPRRPAS